MGDVRKNIRMKNLSKIEFINDIKSNLKKKKISKLEKKFPSLDDADDQKVSLNPLIGNF